VPLPASLNLGNTELFAQFFVVDWGLTNAFPMTVSDTHSIRLGVPVSANVPYYGRTVWRHGALEWSRREGGRMSPRNYVAITKFL
jgi:hypothetical protein